MRTRRQKLVSLLFLSFLFSFFVTSYLPAQNVPTNEKEILQFIKTNFPLQYQEVLNLGKQNESLYWQKLVYYAQRFDLVEYLKLNQKWLYDFMKSTPDNAEGFNIKYADEKQILDSLRINFPNQYERVMAIKGDVSSYGKALVSAAKNIENMYYIQNSYPEFYTKMQQLSNAYFLPENTKIINDLQSGKISASAAKSFLYKQLLPVYKEVYSDVNCSIYVSKFNEKIKYLKSISASSAAARRAIAEQVARLEKQVEDFQSKKWQSASGIDKILNWSIDNKLKSLINQKGTKGVAR